MNPELARADDGLFLPTPTQNRLHRWMELLSVLKFELIHIPGEDNVWADLLSRWGNSDLHRLSSAARASLTYPLVRPGKARKRRRKAISMPPKTIPVQQASFNSFDNYGYSPTMDDFEFPTPQSIRATQDRHRDEISSDVYLDESMGVFRLMSTHSIWIPSGARELQVSLCVLAHCGRAGHRGLATTLDNLRDYTWASKDKDVKNFCSSCLQCSLTKDGLVIPRQWGEQLHGSEPNQVVSFDYLYIKTPRQQKLLTTIHIFF